MRAALSFFNHIPVIIRYGLCGLIFALPSVFYLGFTQNFQFPKTMVFQVTVAFFTLLFVIHLIYFKKIVFPQQKPLFWILCSSLIFSFLASTVLSLAPLISFFGNIFNNEGLFQIIYLMMWMILVYSFFKKEDFFIFLEVILASAIVPSLVALGQYFLGTRFFLPLGDSLLGRTIGTLGQPNFLGQFLALTLLINCLLLFKPRWRIFHGVAFFLMFSALFTTGSRAGFLSFGVGLAFFLIFYFQKFVEKRIFIVFSVLAVVLFSAFLIVVRSNSDGMRSMQSRFIMWKSFAPVIVTLPPFGYGLEVTEFVYDRYKNPSIYEYELFTGTTQSAHNIFLDILITRGYFGLLIFLGIMVYGVWKSFQNRKIVEVWFISSLFFGWLVGMMVSFSVINHWLIIFGLIPFFLKFTSETVEFRIQHRVIFVIIGAFAIFFSGFSFFIISQNIIAERAFFQFATASDIDQKEMFLLKAVNANNRQKYYLGEAVVFFMQHANYRKIAEIMPQSLKLNNYASYKDFLALAIANAYLFQDMEQSATMVKAAQALSPNEPSLFLLWGNTLFSFKKYNEAVMYYEKYLSLVPSYWKWDDSLRLKSFADKEKYRIFFKTFPNFRSAFERLSVAYSELGNEKKAFYYKKFIK